MIKKIAAIVAFTAIGFAAGRMASAVSAPIYVPFDSQTSCASLPSASGRFPGDCSRSTPFALVLNGDGTVTWTARQ